MPYVELRAHTAFSFGDGAVTPEGLVSRAAELGYDAIGITDCADLGGVVRATLEARRRGIRLVVGAELCVDGSPLALLARDERGCRNLCALVTCSRMGELRGWPARDAARARGLPGVTWEQLASRSEGLHLLTGPPSGAIASLAREGRTGDAARQLAAWREVFGGRLAVEVQLHRVSGSEAALASALVGIAESTAVPWVVTHDPRYVDGDGRLAHDMLTALRCGTDLDGAEHAGLLHPNGDWRLYAPGEMATLWTGRERGLEMSALIAAECDFNLGWLRPPLPRAPGSNGRDDNELLRGAVYEGAHTRWGSVDARQRGQLEHELEVIGKLGFAGFFLVMLDAVRFAEHNNILCQGRGSAANSAVAYCLGITAVDPVKHGLLFERFLSEVRVDGQTEAPDIDVDVEHDRREELLDYVYGRYGRRHSAITCVVQTYRAPNAVLDAMRALGYPADLALKLSKRLHHHDPAEGAERLRGELAARFGLDVSDARGIALLAAMRALDGLPRMRSTHPGGFVLSAAHLGDHMPIEHTAMGRTILQLDKDDLDAVGVPKFDFLGLGALSMVRRAFDIIERRTGTRPRMYALPGDDAETYDLVARGETVGTFQIESRAQVASILQTRPECLYDIVVQVALIRPGPIQGKFVHPYTRRRRGQEEVTFSHPALQPILARTQGIPIFQEQAMEISMKLGGFSAAEADRLRRTMGNIRKQERLAGVLGELVTRMVTNTGVEPRVSLQVAARISEELQTFANYGFPESHAWSFALIAYATAYLKRHHPAEFYAGLLNSWPMGFYSPATLIHDARRHGVEVRPPCMRDGDWECDAEETDSARRPALRIGWRHIRGVGARSIERLRAAHAAAPFSSVADVVTRAALTRAESVQLARAGAFGAWEGDRRRAAWEALRAAGDSLPLAPAHRLPYEPRPLDDRELVFLDYLATGICITGHPVQHVRERLSAAGAVDSRGLEALSGGEHVLVGGLVVVRQRPVNAGGTVFLLMEDEHGFINVIVPRQVAEKNAEVVRFSAFMIVQGRFERDGAVMSVVGRRFSDLAAGQLAYRSHDFH